MHRGQTIKGHGMVDKCVWTFHSGLLKFLKVSGLRVLAFSGPAKYFVSKLVIGHHY